MTKSQLTAIAPEWVVANGEIFPRIALSYSPTIGEANERLTIVKQHTYATDLPDGTYSAEGLKVVWEVRNRIGNRGMYDNTNLSEFKSVSKEYYDHFVTFGDAELHRIKITK